MTAIPAKVERGVLFVDVCDSVTITLELGDEESRRVIKACLRVLQERLEELGGRVIERKGDELLVLFEGALQTVRAGVEAQLALAAAIEKGALHEHLRVRIGLHYGELLDGDTGISGDTVHVASRVSSLAKAGQVLTTEETLDCLPENCGYKWRLFDRVRLKGRPEETAIYEILYGPDVTEPVEGEEERPRRPPTSVLELCYESVCVIMGAEQPRLSLGRDETCGLVIDHKRVSRRHRAAQVRLRARGREHERLRH